MQDRKDVIAGSIVAALEALPLPPEPRPLLRNPYIQMRGRFSEYRAAVAALLLRNSNIPTNQILADLCLKLANNVPLADGKASESAEAALNALYTLRLERERAIEYIRQVPTLKDFARVQRLVELGDISYAERLTRASPELDYFDRQVIQYRMLVRVGKHVEADQIAEELYQIDCVKAATANIRTWFIFRSVGATSLPEPNGDPKYLAKYLTALHLAGKQEATLDIASRHIDLIEQNIGLAQALLPLVLTRETQEREWRRKMVGLVQEKYAPVARLSFNYYYGYGDEPGLSEVLSDFISAGAHAYLCSALIERAISQATDIHSYWRQHRETFKLLMQINYSDICEANTAFTNYIQSLKSVRLLERSDLHAAFDATMFREYDVSNLHMAFQNLDDASQKCLEELRETDCGAILYCTHIHLHVGATFAPAGVASLAGHRVISTVGHAWPRSDCRHKEVADKFHSFGAGFEIRNMNPASAATDTKALMDHLSNGGVIQLTNDALVGSGQRAFVPWVTMPFVQNVYAAQLCLSKGAQLVFAASWFDKGDVLKVKYVAIPEPPEQGNLFARSVWLTQYAARRIRDTVRKEQLTYSLNALASFGGVQIRDDMVPITKWFSSLEVSQSLVARFQDAHDDSSVALSLLDRSFTYRDLQQYALRAASLFLHCQAGKPAHHKQDRRFLDQHRVVLILPKSEALLSLSIGCYLSGSLLLVCEDDLSDMNMTQRLTDFQPDVIISTASRWSKLLRYAGELKSQPVMIIEDDCSQEALDELLYGFLPTQELPNYDSDQAAFAVYTSGSDGKPKATIIPAGVLSNASGIDRCAQLTACDRAVYLGRWDSICIAEVFALVRGRCTICIPDDQIIISPTRFQRWLEANGITFLSAPVTIWKYLSLAASSDESAAWPMSLTKGLLWGERIFPAVVEKLNSQWQNLQLYCIYGASELTYISFGKLSTHTFEGIDGSPGGIPISGHSIIAVDDEGNQLTNAKGGSNIRVVSPNAMIGYWSDLVYYNPFQSKRDYPFVIIHDNVRIRSDGSLVILGRTDSIVKIAGRRISLIEVQDAVEMLESVSQAIALTRSEEEQTTLALGVESVTDKKEDLEQQIRQTIIQKIGSFALPKALFITEKFPQLQSGKLDSKAIQEFAFTGLSDQDVVSPKVEPMIPVDNPSLRKIYSWLRASGHTPSLDFGFDSLLPEFSSLELIELHIILEELEIDLGQDSEKLWRRPISWGELLEKNK